MVLLKPRCTDWHDCPGVRWILRVTPHVNNEVLCINVASQTTCDPRQFAARLAVLGAQRTGVRSSRVAFTVDDALYPSRLRQLRRLIAAVHHAPLTRPVDMSRRLPYGATVDQWFDAIRELPFMTAIGAGYELLNRSSRISRTLGQVREAD